MTDYWYCKPIAAALAAQSLPQSTIPPASHLGVRAGQTRTVPRIIGLPTIAKEEIWLLDPPRKRTASP